MLSMFGELFVNKNAIIFLRDVEDLKHVCDTFEEPWVIRITNEIKCAIMSKNLIMHDVNHVIRDNKACNM